MQYLKRGISKLKRVKAMIKANQTVMNQYQRLPNELKPEMIIIHDDWK